MTEFGVNFIRNRAFGEFCQYDAWHVQNNTPYGQWVAANFPLSMLTTPQEAGQWNTDEPPVWTPGWPGAVYASWGKDIPWLFGNDYTDWAIAKFASLGVTWIRDWAMIGGWPRLFHSAPVTDGAVTGPIVFDEDLDWSVLDRTVAKTAQYGIKLVLTLPHAYDNYFGGGPWVVAGDASTHVSYATISSRVINYLLAPFAAKLAERYQDYTHIYIDPMNEGTWGQAGAAIIPLQRAVYQAVKAALPVGKKNNVKVQLVSSIGFNDTIALINAIGSEVIYEGHVTPHIYIAYPANTFDYGEVTGDGWVYFADKVTAIRAALATAGRADVGIRLDEFGTVDWNTLGMIVDATTMANIPNMMTTATATGDVDAVLLWGFYPSSQDGNWDDPESTEVGTSGFNISANLWDYGSFNQANLPEPFAPSLWLDTIAELGLPPLLPTVGQFRPCRIAGKRLHGKTVKTR